jgi:hypothetical protein
VDIVAGTPAARIEPIIAVSASAGVIFSDGVGGTLSPSEPLVQILGLLDQSVFQGGDLCGRRVSITLKERGPLKASAVSLKAHVSNSVDRPLNL